MTFVEEIRKIQSKKRKAVLTDLEVEGDPEKLAVSFSNFKIDKQMKPIRAPRASGLYDACMRFHVIGTILELSESEWASLKGKLIFGIGNSVHDWLQNSSELFGEGRFGWWQCRACQKVRYFGAPPQKPCEHCGAHKDATFYLEHFMKLTKPLIVTGHPDMFFRPEKQKKIRFAEIKTMAGDEFDALVAPKADHEWQLQTYMWGSEYDSTLPVEVDGNVGYTVYVTKRSRKDSFPLKIFPVFRNEDLIRRIRAKLTLYKQGIVDYPKNIPPPIDECVRGKFEGYRAKTCVCLKECVVRKK